MPPKIKITREKIIETAFCLARTEGADKINARSVAAILECSTQPIFSNFATMKELRLAVVKEADDLCKEYMRLEVEKEEFPTYKASGMAYILFAQKEKELFKLLYMRDRKDETTSDQTDGDKDMENIVQSQTGLEETNAKLFHLEMWAFVHGIATMFATGFLDLDRDLVSKMLTDAYQGLRKQFGLE